jgi:hypothetical protein
VELHRSEYCKALGLPSGPTSIGAVLLTLGLFGAPTIIALVGAARRRLVERRLQRIAGCFGALVILSSALVAFAHVRAVGVD